MTDVMTQEQQELTQQLPASEVQEVLPSPIRMVSNQTVDGHKVEIFYDSSTTRYIAHLDGVPVPRTEGYSESFSLTTVKFHIKYHC